MSSVRAPSRYFRSPVQRQACASVTAHAARVTVTLDIVPDEDNPHGLLSAADEAGEPLAQVRVVPSFKLNRASAVAWAESGFAKPAGR